MTPPGGSDYPVQARTLGPAHSRRHGLMPWISPYGLLEIFAGFVLVTLLLFDIFQAVLVPRFTPASMRLTPNLIGRFAWPIFRKFSAHVHNEMLLDHMLGVFAPFVFVLIFSLAMASLILGFGMIVLGLGPHFTPQIDDYGTACYTAATAVLTLGFGDFVATGPLARIILIIAASTGISVAAIAVSFIFSMQTNVHLREQMVHAMQMRIKPENSALAVLLNYADLGITNQLISDIQSWEMWMAQVLTSHRSFPLLCYFRSGHGSVPWVTVIGIMLDVANLLSTTVNEKRYAHSAFLLHIGTKILVDFRNYFDLAPVEVSIQREEFCQAYAQLKARGYVMHDEEVAWERFHLNRSQYAPSLNALCYQFLSPLPNFAASLRSEEKTGANIV